ncbi:MAG TPA: ABC transporter permease [Gemmatimonadaceae bacterium]|jgi:ABC-type polysaccharide/polyol phosphate export systems, permease component
MREVLSLIRASWRTALSYRLSMVLSLVSLLVTVVPLFFVARALQPVMANSIATQGGEYFGFLLVGMIAYSFLSTAVNSVPGVISSGISNGTLEALLGTRASLSSLLVGLIGYKFLWTAIRALVLLSAGLVLGVHLAWGQGLVAIVIIALIVLAYLPFGLVAAALVLAFRTTGPFPSAVLILSGLLGGVYYPTTVIPSWIQRLSDVVPLTYGLRALRHTLLEGMPFSAVAGDVATLLGFVVLLTAVGLLALSEALHYARRTGTLAQY